MISSTVLTLIVIPAIYSLWQEARVRKAARHDVTVPQPQPAGAD
jgi:hypothetical protein